MRKSIVRENINGIELRCLDDNVYSLDTQYIMVFDKSQLKDIKKHYKKNIEELTGMRCIYAAYQLIADIEFPAYRLLPKYYLVKRKR